MGIDSSRARTILVALLVAAASLLAACGGGDSEPATDDGPTRPQYIAEVDALCKKTTRASRPTNRKIQALVNGSGTYSSRLMKATPLLQTTYDLQKSKLDGVKSVQPPAADREQVAKVVAASEKALEEFRGGIPIAKRGDLKEFIDVAFDANGSRATAERLGTQYGFAEDCFAIPIDLGTL